MHRSTWAFPQRLDLKVGGQGWAFEEVLCSVRTHTGKADVVRRDAYSFLEGFEVLTVCGSQSAKRDPGTAGEGPLGGVDIRRGTTKKLTGKFAFTGINCSGM
jgi:hypothetical protein